MCPRPIGVARFGSVQIKPSVSGRRDFIDLTLIALTHVGHKNAGLSRYVGTYVPRISPNIESAVGHLRDVSNPRVLRCRFSLDCPDSFLTGIADSGRDPRDMLLNGRHHVRKYRRASRASDSKQVWKTSYRQTEVCLRPIRPSITDSQPTPTSNINVQQGARHGIEPGCVNNTVDLVLVRARPNPLRSDFFDRLLANIN